MLYKFPIEQPSDVQYPSVSKMIINQHCEFCKGFRKWGCFGTPVFVAVHSVLSNLRKPERKNDCKILEIMYNEFIFISNESVPAVIPNAIDNMTN